MSIEINGAGVITGVDSLSTPAVTNAAGSASTPSITFTGDTNTGLYSPGADQVAVTTGGTGRLFIDSSGRVGLGTSSPGEPLNVLGGGSTTSTVNFTGGATGNDNATIASDYSLNFQIDANNNIGGREYSWRYGGKGYGDGTPLMTLDASGRLGVGTTNPGSALDVASGTVRAGNYALVDGGTTVAGYVGFATTNGPSFEFWGSGSAQSGSLIARIGGNEAARIDSSRRLLVGTATSPSAGSWSQYARLVVKGNTQGNASAGTLNLGTAVAATSMGSSDTVGMISFSDLAGNEFATIGAFADGTISSTSDLPGKLVFSTTADGASSPTERMRISSSGITSFTSNTVSFRTTENNISIQSDRTSGTAFAFISGRGNSGADLNLIIWNNGNIQNANNSYGAISDVKLKENIVDAGSQWDDLKAFKVRKYNFKEGQTHTQIGLVAQEVELVSPGLVTESPDRDAEGNDLGTVTKSVNYSVLYMKAVRALQEAMERIETLEASNTDLLARVSALESA